MQKLVIIDGNAIMHRAYHALPPLTSTDGRVVNAVYGFTSMLLRVINDLTPTYLAVTFDRPEPTFRKQLYKEYQSHRPKMEDDLGQQFAVMKEVLAAMKIQMFEKAGFEADDVIGTIANQVKSAKIKAQSQVKSPKIDETVIVTGDRDILQLVDDNIKVYMPVKGLSESKLYDAAAVREKYGINPSQLVDYKALVGDASDNYGGVAGIGPKTAAELLHRYHTLENLYANIDKEKNEKLRNKLKLGEKDAEMAKELATIVTNVPVEIDLGVCKLHPLDTLEVESVLEKLSFHSLWKRIKGEEDKPKITVKKIEKEDSQLSFFSL